MLEQGSYKFGQDVQGCYKVIHVWYRYGTGAVGTSFVHGWYKVGTSFVQSWYVVS